jgi:hypothetical protein
MFSSRFGAGATQSALTFASLRTRASLAVGTPVGLIQRYPSMTPSLAAALRSASSFPATTTASWLPSSRRTSLQSISFLVPSLYSQSLATRTSSSYSSSYSSYSSSTSSSSKKKKQQKSGKKSANPSSTASCAPTPAGARRRVVRSHLRKRGGKPEPADAEQKRAQHAKEQQSQGLEIAPRFHLPTPYEHEGRPLLFSAPSARYLRYLAWFLLVQLGLVVSIVPSLLHETNEEELERFWAKRLPSAKRDPGDSAPFFVQEVEDELAAESGSTVNKAPEEEDEDEEDAIWPAPERLPVVLERVAQLRESLDMVRAPESEAVRQLAEERADPRADRFTRVAIAATGTLWALTCVLAFRWYAGRYATAMWAKRGQPNFRVQHLDWMGRTRHYEFPVSAVVALEDTSASGMLVVIRPPDSDLVHLFMDVRGSGADVKRTIYRELYPRSVE